MMLIVLAPRYQRATLMASAVSFRLKNLRNNVILLILLPSNIPILKNLFAQTNTAHCLDNEYVCDYYKNCMVKDLLCNGDDDCYYGEDEKDCGKINYLKLHTFIVLNVHTHYIK